MSNIMKKDSSGLPALSIPNLPEIFTRLMPSQTPELTFDKGFIRGTVHKWKLRRMAEVSGHEAVIAENRYRSTKATADSVLEALTFGDRCQNAMMRYEHERYTMAHEKNMMVLAEKKEEAIVAQEVFKAKTMEIDYEDAKLNHQLKLKELGNDYQDEDRE